MLPHCFSGCTLAERRKSLRKHRQSGAKACAKPELGVSARDWQTGRVARGVLVHKVLLRRPRGGDVGGKRRRRRVVAAAMGRWPGGGDWAAEDGLGAESPL